MNTTADTVTYRIDADDHLCGFDDHWSSFAADNESPHLSDQLIFNRPIWDFIQDAETRHIHETLLKRVRTNNTPLSFPFRCDAPTLRRYMEMKITPLDNRAVEYRCHIVRTEVREPIETANATADHDDNFLRMCS
ncbi:hypothetical protein BOW53_13070 [Solemya pervernicosa gill symbiont]|uniref:PAS fold-4 domain-containing protein n=2 Tax=Gammaproteobacteria incertae sedis TaxID=118884 RepID=A0A1T2L210_9GAMM|nr:hypothetical protein [Candidatus Reidiella endopervernicosa]OOZ39060.1 hypothetical protein BOW53_13070 [Solemya pervernicosa gill symbiont]QKQ25173.1 hypothetical protein HUE57_01870 [Candidatus Reidiella endopervernicosa]